MADLEGGGVTNHLKNVLQEHEITNISTETVSKINKYIDSKFEEFLTSKALYETSRKGIGDKVSNYDNTILELKAQSDEKTQRLAAAEESINQYVTQVKDLKTDSEKLQEKISRLEGELACMKNARDAAVDELNDVTRTLQRRDAELERLRADEASLSAQLKAAIDAKCEALAASDEVQSKELTLQYKEKRMEQERTLMNSQIASLNEEVNRLTSELQTVRLNYTSRLFSMESQLSEKSEEINSANITISQLNELKNNLNTKVENFAQRLMEQREVENKMIDNYKKELDAKTKLADLFKSMHDDAESKTAELTEGITELQKLLHEATERYGELETKNKQMELDNEELLEKKNETIASLKNELVHANELLKMAKNQTLDAALSDLAPSAATASKLLKSGMSLTQVYSQLVKITEDLAQEKEENRKLNFTINTIVQELEEKAPQLQKQKSEYEEAMENNTALSRQLESVVMECNRLRDELSEVTKISNHFNRENEKLKGELSDLGRQVCFLLKEIDESRGGGMANGDHDPSLNNSNPSEMNSSRVISKTLVTFGDIQELQSNNQKLLRLVRELTEKQEEYNLRREQIESGDMEQKLEQLTNRVTELNEAQTRQTKMVNGLIRQRDMYKKLYHDIMRNKGKDVSKIEKDDFNDSNKSMDMSDSDEKSISKPQETTVIETRLKETEKHLEMLKEEYKNYKEEKSTTEKMLVEQIDNMRQEISRLTASNSKCSATSEYNNERLKILQANITTYKKQISSLEEKNKIYNETIARHEISLQHIRDEALNAQSKLATAEVSVENLKMECKLLKDAESRWQAEREILHRERNGQALLLNNLEVIKVSLERTETDSRIRLETRLDEATRECSALRRRLQEEQDRFRELSSHLERQTTTAKERMNEEKEAADTLRGEVEQLRKDLNEKNKTIEELNSKLKIALMPNRPDGTFDSLKKIRDLEKQLTEKQEELQNVSKQLEVTKEHVTQYCNIAECAEKELKALNEKYMQYYNETSTKIAESDIMIAQLKERCSELEAEISIQNNGQAPSTDVRNQLLRSEQELKNAMQTIEELKNELSNVRSEMSKLAGSVQIAEDKYAHEMVLHSNDIQALTNTKQELMKIQNEMSEVISLKNQINDQFEASKLGWQEREKLFVAEKKEVEERLDDLIKQNNLLHEQIASLGTQISLSQSRTGGDSFNESSTEPMCVSISEDDNKSSDQLFQIIKYLRKEKDIAIAKFDILQAECSRLKSQLEVTEKKLDESKLALSSEREKSEVNVVTLTKHSDILRKVETLNALADSNRILRDERDTLHTRVQELESTVKMLEEKLAPLEERIIDITSKNDTLQSENTSLKAETARWRTRVNALVERANKTSPEDWKRLQNERETLAKMLTAEKETIKKLNEELLTVKTEKTKVDEDFSALTKRFDTQIAENKNLTEELNSLRADITKLSEELNKSKQEITSLMEERDKLSSEVAAKENALTDIRNKEMQIRKIAKKYKTQFEELNKSVEEEKKKAEESQASEESQAASSLKQAEEKINALEAELATERSEMEKLRSDLETLRTANSDKEEKAKQILRTAKSKIVQLTETKNSLTRELNESRAKMEVLEQSNRDEQEERLSLIKSQYEGRLSRLEKERGEIQTERTREVEALMQKVNMLQRQLASQSSSSKQQPTSEKPTCEPPTANIKPTMAGVPTATQCRRASEPPLASIRPMQVGSTPSQPTAAEHTEYMPASSSRTLHRNVAPSPPESTQDMETSEASTGSGSSNESTSSSQTSTHAQPTQQVVALVLPRVEPSVPGAVSEQASQSGNSVSTSGAGVPGVSTSGPGVSTTGVGSSAPSSSAAGVGSSAPGVQSSTSGPGVSTSAPSTSGPGVSTSGPAAPAPDARAPKRARPSVSNQPAKRTRAQGFERSVEVEYQVPTSSRCDQEDDGVIVVDSEEDDDNRCSGTAYQEGSTEAEGDAEGEAEGESYVDEDEDDDLDDEPDDHHQEVPPTAPLQPEPSAPSEGVMVGTNVGEEGDDSIVPSTPTLYVPRLADGVAPARFTFSEAAHETMPELAPAVPPTQGDNEGETSTEDASAVSSQGSPTRQEEEREARARRPQRRPMWQHDENRYNRGRGIRGRPMRRPHNPFSRF